ncbi:MAG TPA: hypothetical protein VMY39_07645, partial [Planctomycetota bacterium]|nr:hypothetical protein [Planctomycetota bacterium]
FIVIYPAIAGALVVLLAFVKPVEPRAIGLMLLGVIPAVVVFADDDVRRFFGRALEGQGGLVFLMLATLGIGWMCVFAGARARWWRPGKSGAYGIGVVGAVMLAVGLLIPALPREAGRVLLAAPFVAMSHEGTGWFVFYALLQMGCVIGAAAICVANRPQGTFDVVRAWASWAFALVILGILVGITCVLHFMVKTAPPDLTSAGLFPVIVTFGKFVAWWYGLGLLIPFGITDWLVGDPFAKDLKTVLEEMKQRRPPGGELP